MSSLENVKAVFSGRVPENTPIWDEIIGCGAAANRELEFDFDIIRFGFDQMFGLAPEDLKEFFMAGRLGEILDEKAEKGPDECFFKKASIGTSLNTGDYEKCLSLGKAKALCFYEPFGFLCEVLGHEFFLTYIASAQKPCLQKIFNSYCRFILGIFDRLKGMNFVFDIAWAWGDMAYAKGVYFSPDFYRESLFAPHKNLFSGLRERGYMRVLHSDGDIKALAPSLAQAGVQCLHPLDTTSLDPLAFKRDYPDIIAFGGVDPSYLTQENGAFLAAADAEKLRQGGRYMYSLSGPVPNGIGQGQYVQFLRKMKKALRE